jgi:hypothetical protein
MYTVTIISCDIGKKSITNENNYENKEYKKVCKHLKGTSPGELYCDVHLCNWYKETPCYKYTQIERRNTVCRMGDYILNNKNKKMFNFLNKLINYN